MGSGFLFLSVRAGLGVTFGSVGFVATMFVEAFGVLPGMAFAGDTKEGKAGEEQSGSFHTCANLPAIARVFNFLFRNRPPAPVDPVDFRKNPSPSSGRRAKLTEP